jgi:predicted Fe-Mo cluster-binding NifX family protein
MKVAITSTGDNLDSMVDRRFGRCHFFVFYDTVTGNTDILPNPNIHSLEGVGAAAVQLVAEKNVQKVVSGEFGAKAKSLFDQLHIQLVSVPEEPKSVRQIIELLELKYK